MTSRLCCDGVISKAAIHRRIIGDANTMDCSIIETKSSYHKNSLATISCLASSSKSDGRLKPKMMAFVIDKNLDNNISRVAVMIP